MATVRDLLKGSLRLLGAISTGETPTSEELTDGLSVLNDMLDSWATEKLLVYGRVREEFSLVSGTQSYTIGSAGTFNTSRPQGINEATIEDQSVSPTTEYRLHILNDQEWSEIKIKDLTGNIPTKLYMEEGFPLNTLYFWPKPSSTNKVVLYSWKPFTAFATLDTTVSMPPGFAKALRYNLALELAPEYGKSASPELVSGAMESKENIKRMNIKPQYLSVDAALMGSKPFNIETGE